MCKGSCALSRSTIEPLERVTQSPFQKLESYHKLSEQDDKVGTYDGLVSMYKLLILLWHWKFVSTNHAKSHKKKKQNRIQGYLWLGL